VKMKLLIEMDEVLRCKTTSNGQKLK